jgi:TolC family type I secretion outer membrane protein
MWRRLIILGVIAGVCSINTDQAYSQARALTIRDCIQIALRNNSDLKNAERMIDLAASGVTSARANILPSINASFSPARTFQAEQGPFLVDVPIIEDGKVVRIEQQELFQNEYYRNSFSNSVSISQTIFDGGRWWNQIKQANADYRSSEFGHRNTREQTISTVVQRYYELLKSIDLEQVSEQAVESSREQLRKTESMYELGAVAQVDVFRSKVSLGQDLSSLILQRNAVKLNRNNLNIAMGRNPGQPVEILSDDPDVQPLEATTEELWAMAEQSNPELYSLEETLKASDYGRKISKAVFLPRLTFTGSYSRFNTEFGSLYAPFDKNFQVRGSFSLSWNLFNGFADAAAVNRASLTFQINRENLINRKLTLRNELERAYLNLKANTELERINEDNVVSAEEDLRLNDERYRVGAGTLLEVIDARVALNRARAVLISTKYNKLIYLVELYSKIGNVEEKLESILQ